jgi:acyl-CoA thioesterase FadM
MIVLVRLLWALIRSQFKRKLDLLDESALTMRVWPNDLDLNVHMNSGRYVSMMDIGRVELLGRMRLLHVVFGRRKWRPLAGAATIRYRRSLLPFQRFTVRTKIVCWDEKWLYYRQVIERRGEPCTIGYVRMLLRGPEGNVTPAQILELAGRSGMESPPMPDEIAQWARIELR